MLVHGGMTGRNGTQSQKALEVLRRGWKPKTILGKRICISEEEEKWAAEFERKMSESGDIYADKIMIELAITQVLQVHRIAEYAASQRVGKDMSKPVGTLLSTMREMNATKNSRKENKIDVSIKSDIMTLIQNISGGKDKEAKNGLQRKE